MEDSTGAARKVQRTRAERKNRNASLWNKSMNPGYATSKKAMESLD